MLMSGSDVYFEGRCRFQTFTPIWAHVNEKEKKMSKIVKNPNFGIHDSLNNFDRMCMDFGE